MARFCAPMEKASLTHTHSRRLLDFELDHELCPSKDGLDQHSPADTPRQPPDSPDTRSDTRIDTRIDIRSDDRSDTRSHPAIAYDGGFPMNNSSFLSSNDIDFLESQGCMKVPEQIVLDQVVRQYFRYVHPLLPLLDEKETWAAYNHSTTRSKTRIPLVLLQAMMFASCNVSLGFSASHLDVAVMIPREFI